MKRQYSASTGRRYHPGRSAEWNTKEGENHWKDTWGNKNGLVELDKIIQQLQDRQTDKHTHRYGSKVIFVNRDESSTNSWLDEP